MLKVHTANMKPLTNSIKHHCTRIQNMILQPKGLVQSADEGVAQNVTFTQTAVGGGKQEWRLARTRA